MDKQIEEMAKVLLETSCKGSECENCAFVKNVKEAKETCVCLKALYNAGYRKIPENAVVLTQEEWAVHNEQFAQAMYQKEVSTRKETAEKFAEAFKQRMKDRYQGTGLWWTEVVLIAIEICKEITEGDLK